MIEIKDKHDCCGCSACVQKCPAGCIEFPTDEEGFQYPVVNADACIGCGLCEKVCPEINGLEEQKPLQVFAVVNPDREILRDSSSGGAFSFIAKKIVQEGGVVFGAAFDTDWSVHHVAVTAVEDLALLRGSKYLQSRIEDSYKQAEAYLKKGKKVMFTGTSCQIKGLRLFLRKKYDSLLTVECLCHGVPSPLVWQKYLRQTVDVNKITDISFRDKRDGWENYFFSIQFKNEEFAERSRNNTYMKGFLSNLYLRPSCECCPAKNGRSGSDILLADYWGVRQLHPELLDMDGTGLAIPFTAAGQSILEGLSCNPVELEEARRYNEGFSDGAKRHKKRAAFFAKFRNKPLVPLIESCLRPSLSARVRNKIKFFLRKVYNL